MAHAATLAGSCPPEFGLADDVPALLERAEQLLREARPAEAETLCHQIIEADPGQSRAHHFLGVALTAQDQPERAVESFKRAITLDGKAWTSQFNLAFILAGIGRRQEALEYVRAAIVSVRPCPPPVHQLLVRLSIESGDWDAAIAAADQGLADHPLDGELIALRGCARRNQGYPDESLAAQEQFLAIRPNSIPALSEKGWALLDLGRPTSAMEVFDRALEGDDPEPVALIGMGVAQLRCRMFEAALAALNEGVAHDPRSFHGHFFRAVALQELQRRDEARRAYSELLEQWPDCAEGHANLSLLQREAGNLETAEKAQRHALEIRPDDPGRRSNLLSLLLYKSDQTPETLAHEHAQWDAQFGFPANRYKEWRNDRDPDRALRVGIVSAELVRHPVSALLVPALRALDHRQFQLICYSSLQQQRDAVTAQIEGMVHGFRDVANLDDDALAAQIRADDIDILIEITGHFRGNRLPVFARRPAPVQASWLGYAYTTGLSAIDYAIMDPVLVRPDEDQWFRETVIRLPGGRICFAPPDGAGPVAAPPVLRNGFITFGSFNNVTKISQDVVDAWCAILARLPTARLILKAKALSSPGVADNLRSKFLTRGVQGERIELRGPSPKSRLYAEYADIDIALDPFPFGGGVTSCDTLWMGVPLVTLPSWQPVSRQSESFLRAIGRSEWVARDLDDYLQIATNLAGDPLRLADLRLSQQEEMRASPLCDEARLGRELGEALRRMWHTFIARNG